MLTYPWPYRLLADRDLYTAALHTDLTIASSAFDRWVSTVRVDDIDYHAQKPLAMAWGRHERAYAQQEFAGVFGNVRRKAFLRTHAIHQLLQQVLQS